MNGSKPKAHHRTSRDGTAYTVETSQHEHGISIVVVVPGLAPLEDEERTFVSEAEALAAGDEIAAELIGRQASHRL